MRRSFFKTEDSFGIRVRTVVEMTLRQDECEIHQNRSCQKYSSLLVKNANSLFGRDNKQSIQRERRPITMRSTMRNHNEKKKIDRPRSRSVSRNRQINSDRITRDDSDRIKRNDSDRNIRSDSDRRRRTDSERHKRSDSERNRGNDNEIDSENESNDSLIFEDFPGTTPDNSGWMSSNVTEDDRDRTPACYVSEPTGWTIPDSEMTDPVYVRDSDMSSFVPLPQAEAENRPSADPRIEEHFIGVRTREEASDLFVFIIP
ncbi:hypothetical protein DICVIV_03965 [Dictyocaulus viviparus]|uniref:Uncharacterized protein n=1 Tax=Dictyocaulus viviparus TaxID=29172 RepID=A0A0D8XZN7_DICVI|nr:hypothetical protein DICVIV_03965 [Dictyocaulus viviparus]